MGVGSDNPWWLDVLEWGPAQPLRRRFFDIDWEASARGVRGKITAAGAGRSVRQGARGGRAQAAVRRRRGRLLRRLLRRALSDRGAQLPAAAALGRRPARSRGRRRCSSSPRSSARWPPRTPAPSSGWCAGRRRSRSRRRWPRPPRDASVRAALDAAVAALNGTPGLPETFEPLHALLEDQAYRLAYWRVASSEINYRRFFDINQLAGLRMERGEVFEATHRLLLRLIAEGKVQGVRLDHIDGMYDPRGYCQRLLSRVADVLAERRTASAPRSTPAPAARSTCWSRRSSPATRTCARTCRSPAPPATSSSTWSTACSSIPAAERPLTATYHRFIDREPDFDQIVLAAKQQILRYSLNSELHVLGHEFHRLAQQSWRTRDFTLTGLREALADIITRFPVYRTYITDGRRQARGPARPRLGGQPGAQGDRAGRPHGLRLPARRAVDRSGRHARLRARRRDRDRDALPAAHRAGDGEVARGHRLLSLPPAGLAERGRRRAGAFRRQPGGLPSPDAADSSATTR